MSRERRQNGWVEKTGKKTKSWTGYWYVYVMEDGRRSVVDGRRSWESALR
jgi:hypothetical protein